MPQNLFSDPTQNSSEQSESLWMEVQLPLFPQLDKNLDADICIVGGGIVGLTCAYTLCKEGKSVVILDERPTVGGQTPRTTAHLTWALDHRYFNLKSHFGSEEVRLAANSHAAAIDYIEKIISDEKIECDFERVDGYLFAAPEDSKDTLEKEFSAIQKFDMGVDKLEKTLLNSSFDAGESLRFPRQAQFHILKYLKGLITALLKNKVKIFNHTKVKSFEDGFPCTVTTESGLKVSAKSIIVATCTPINNRFIIHTKQSPYRTYVIAGTIPKESVSKGLYWDTADPYHYVRLQKHDADPFLDWLIVGGEDHRTGQDQANHQENERYNQLEEWARLRFPMLKEISYKWSGQVFEPFDGLAFMGRNAGDQNIYIATGHSGNGITNGTIAGILLPDLILKRANPWESLYDPSRKTFSAASEYIEDNLNVAVQYRDWLTSGEINKIDQLPPNEGIIIREGLKKIAVYKDANSKVHLNSACCPHLGGCVRWNPYEKTWDCPCHGSQFDGCGKVLIGPAISDLSPCPDSLQ